MGSQPILARGKGLFLGVLVELEFSEPILELTARLEYRTFTASFIPSYFDALYEVDRFQYPFTGGEPKLAVLDDGASTPAGRGILLSVDGALQNTLKWSFAYINYIGDVNDELGFVLLDVATLQNLNNVLPFRVFARWYRRGVGGFNDMFTVDDRSMLLVQAAWPIFGPL